MIAVAEKDLAARSRPMRCCEQFVRVEPDAFDRLFATRYSLSASHQAAYDAANEQVTFNSLPATFDSNGNQTASTDASGTTTYTWDARNRLVAQAGPGVSATFQYDALGRRISKTVNGVTTQYLYDGNDIVQEIGGSAIGASYVRSLNFDEPFVRQISTGNEFYHVDALGSTLDLTNQTGVVQTSYQYDAFGKTTIAGASANPFQYTGRENDGMGLYYYRARYFSPTFERFISEDPRGISFPSLNSCGLDRIAIQSVNGNGLLTSDFSAVELVEILQNPISSLDVETNLYGYAGGNPVNFVDPLGLQANKGKLKPCLRQLAIDLAKCIWQQIKKPDDEQFEKCRLRALRRFRICMGPLRPVPREP